MDRLLPRVGELEARQIVCQRYQRERFLAALANIRILTREAPEVFVPQIVQQCAAAGVAVVIVPEFKGCCVSGASKWISPGRAMIQLSLRYKRDDQFFFSFFHEAGHLLQEGTMRHEGTEGKEDLTQSTQGRIGSASFYSAPRRGMHASPSYHYSAALSRSRRRAILFAGAKRGGAVLSDGDDERQSVSANGSRPKGWPETRRLPRRIGSMGPPTHFSPSAPCIRRVSGQS